METVRRYVVVHPDIHAPVGARGVDGCPFASRKEAERDVGWREEGLERFWPKYAGLVRIEERDLPVKVGFRATVGEVVESLKFSCEDEEYGLNASTVEYDGDNALVVSFREYESGIFSGDTFPHPLEYLLVSRGGKFRITVEKVEE